MPPLALTNCTGIWGCAFRNWGMMRGSLKLEGREWDSTWRCYDVLSDPHEQHDLAPERPDLVGRGLSLLDQWQGDMMATATNTTDPMRVVLAEGGPLHTRGELPRYLERLRATGRAGWADRLAAAHPKEAAA